MGKFEVRLFSRDYSTPVVVDGLTFDITTMSWSVIGGPDLATIGAKGGTYPFWELIELLRCPVEIYDERREIWWGYIRSMDLQVQNIQISVTLEGMANKIKVTYCQVTGTGQVGDQTETEWISDTLSCDWYGIMEKISTLSQGTAEQAEAQAQTLLSRLKLPIASHTFGNYGEATAVINCCGWWNTLDWEYYEDNNGKESYEAEGAGLQSFGDVSATTKVAQSFQLGSSSGWMADNLEVRLRKNGGPTDNIVISLYADSGGAPGSLLETTTSMAGSALNTTLAWTTFELNSRVILAAGTTYWIVVERSGSLDKDNNYSVDQNEELGYSRGTFRIWNGSTWVARATDADMPFIINGVEETSAQLKDMFSATGQFIEGIDLEVSSGIYSSPYRDGTQTGKSCIEELLKSGTTHYRRMLATIKNDRRVRIYEEPVSDEATDYFVSAKGIVSNFLDIPVDSWEIPVGIWLRLKDVIPATANITKLSDPTKFFLEALQFDNSDQSVILTERDAQRLTDVTVVG